MDQFGTACNLIVMLHKRHVSIPVIEVVATTEVFIGRIVAVVISGGRGVGVAGVITGLVGNFVLAEGPDIHVLHGEGRETLLSGDITHNIHCQLVGRCGAFGNPGGGEHAVCPVATKQDGPHGRWPGAGKDLVGVTPMIVLQRCHIAGAQFAYHGGVQGLLRGFEQGVSP